MNRFSTVYYLILMTTLCFSAFDALMAADGNDRIEFKEGLLLETPRIRGAVQATDAIEKQFVLGTWRAPQSGDQVIVGEESVVWQPVSVDEQGWFSSQTPGPGYLYCTITADKERTMLLEQRGSDFVYVNGALRAGNTYGYKDDYEDWEPYFAFSIVPVKLIKGVNEFLFYNTRTGRLKANLSQPESVVLLNTLDSTLPDMLVGEPVDTWGAVVIINAGDKPMTTLKMAARIGENAPVMTDIPIIQAQTVRKVGVRLQAASPTTTGKTALTLELRDNDIIRQSAIVNLTVKNPHEPHKRTFISSIDGSVQYYAINPAQDADDDAPKALVLSVHGAAVEAINQAASYQGKTWAHIVSPTNRRPYGYNWEDWGRKDGLEVLDIALQSYPIDPSRIYLTGHSMGGHGTWHLGSLFPDRFAVLGPSAGWLSFWSYRVRETPGEKTPMQNMLMRATSPSRTLDIAENYRQLGVYIIHGSDDDNVRVDQSRTMVERLTSFHRDFVYHEEPGQGHWWDLSDEPGTDCVDWPPLFDFFARHARPGQERIRQIDFIVAHPGISAVNHWLTVEAQVEQLKLSRVKMQLDPGKSRFIGTTENIARMSFDLTVMPGDGLINLDMDGQKIENIPRPADADKLWIAKSADRWQVVSEPSRSHKGPHRYGTFKEAFYHRFMFVVGTHGNAQENRWALEKARFDAEQFWYQGNGSVDVIADVDFDPVEEPDRNIILYGNASSNSAWKSLLDASPVVVSAGKIVIGDKTIRGKDLACLFIRPRPGSDTASVGVVSGTGLVGMRLTDRRPYLSPGYAYPDLFVFTPEMLDGQQDKGLLVAGFFGLDWRLDSGEFVWNLNR
ncbi:MAG: alpha/beta hydrolase [Calditrichaeota bacterium]|nr:MAG: alpha/beta hydrolase [Calditrichota bacterium]